MAKAVLDISVSLDGYVSAPDDTLDVGGTGLHDWLFSGQGDVRQGGTPATTGAIISGRRTYDLVNGWNGTHPLGGGVPLFVVTSHVPAEVPAGGTPFTFVTDGVESAVAQAKAAAGDKDVYILGGASLARQLIAARALDELFLHVVPVLFGAGIRLFGGAGHAEFTQTDVTIGSNVTHLRYRFAG